MFYEYIILQSFQIYTRAHTYTCPAVTADLTRVFKFPFELKILTTVSRTKP